MNTGQYTCLEIFAKAKKEGGSVELISSGRKTEEKEAGRTYYSWLKFAVEKDSDYEIVCKDSEVSICYLSGNAEIMETGVTYLEQEEESGCFRPVTEKEQYNSLIREQYHFGPWKNWMNDPNGLCWYKGYYHMFYQFNPHGQEWSNMYWGHAASKDLVHWTHLPVVLAPQEEILERPDEIKGGAFSGSAVVLEDKVIFYLTRHFGPLNDCEETVQQQWMLESSDMIHFTKETLIIGDRPEGASFHFRDPKVLKIGEKWYMVLASAVKDKAAILLYESEDMKNWTYLHPLLIEQEEGICCFECPDFMELDGKYVAIGAWMCHHDECGRYQMSRYYIGEFKNQAFDIEESGWFDFGSNCYAMQSFKHEDRRISIGWISDFYGEHLEWENGAYGSMTIPRELHVKNNKLYMTPVKEIETLKREMIYRGERVDINIDDIPGNAYTAKIRFSENTEFFILLGRDGEKELLLCNDENGFQIKTKGVKSENITFKADVEAVNTLEIFVDHRVVEVYVNDGEAAGTKLFYNTQKKGCFILDAKEVENIESAEISLMDTIWNR